VRGHAGSGPAANASRALVSGASGQRADGTEHAARLSDLKTLDDPEKDEGTLIEGGDKSHGEEGSYSIHHHAEGQDSVRVAQRAHQADRGAFGDEHRVANLD